MSWSVKGVSRNFKIGGVVALFIFLGLAEWAKQGDWSSEIILAVAALFVSLGGFLIAFVEIRRAATVSAATAMAVQKTLTGVAASRLGITITQLRQTVEDLEQATILQDSAGARRAVNAWRNLASEVQAPLKKRFPTQTAVISALHRSIEEGQQIKGTLATTKKQPLGALTAKCLSSMETVGNQLAGLLDELTPVLSEDNEQP
jgi:flagella basal body P-ring formation protein FlgA